MRRRTVIAGGLFALIGAGAAVWSRVPVIPERPEPNPAGAMGWISSTEGRFILTLPRAEMGQNIATALRQVACEELGVSWDAVDVRLHDTTIPPVKATVGSESVMRFAEPLAQACAALRDAVAAGRAEGEVMVVPRPVAELRSFRKGGAVGLSPQITHGREIVTGAPLYAADVRRPEMLYGRVLRAPASVEVSSAPLSWNADAARDISGFAGVVEDTGPALGKSVGLGILATRPGALDAIALALAPKWEIDGSPSPTDVAAAIDIDARLARGHLPHAVLDGEPEPGEWDVDIRLDVPFAAHAAIEPRAAVAEWRGEELTVWTGTQDAFYVRDVLADAFGVPPSGVTVKSCRIGGGFGGRTICTVEAEAAALSRSAGRPVKVQWARAREMAFAFHRPASSHRVRARVQNGRITDWDHAQVSSHILFTAAVLPDWMQRGTDLLVGDGGVARGMAAPYVLGRARAAYDTVRLPIHTGPWRGLGAGPNALAIEVAIDEAAVVARADPLDFRLAHAADTRLAAVLRRVAEVAAWSTPPTPAGGRTGRGIACGIYKETSYAAAVADVAVDERGTVRVTGLWCVHDCGFVVNPDQVRAQCEGNLVWSLGMVLTDELPIAEGRVIAETFADAPIPRMSDVPRITVDLIESPFPPSGAGETAMVAGPGAIANAVRAATGVRPVRFPLRHADFAI